MRRRSSPKEAEEEELEALELARESEEGFVTRSARELRSGVGLRRRSLRWRSSHGFEAEELAGAEGGRWAFTEERRRTPRGLGKQWEDV